MDRDKLGPKQIWNGYKTRINTVQNQETLLLQKGLKR